MAMLLSREAFFAVDNLLKNDDRMIDKLMGGLINTPAQRLDHMINDNVRDFLVGEVGEGRFDLGAATSNTVVTTHCPITMTCASLWA